MKITEQMKKDCDGCNALDDQLERVRVTEGHLVTARAKLQTVRAIADALVKEPRVKQIGEQLLMSLAGDLPSGSVVGVDFGVGPDKTVEQSWITFSCPAGCEHRVLIPDGATIEEAGNAISQVTGLASWQDAGGALCWARHEVVPGEIVGGEPFKNIEEYSEDITDPLTTARDELATVILGVDSEEAWGLTKNPERDHWISGVEQVLAALLKLAQGEEGRRTAARSLYLGAPQTKSQKAVLILAGVGEEETGRLK